MITEEKIHNKKKIKVCILTAGKGSRLEDKTIYFNKSLLRVGNKAVLSHIIDKFPIDSEFVIALGYHGEIVKQYLNIYYNSYNFTFVDIDKYSIAGTGPGYALLKCKKYLQQPFYFNACDTIINSDLDISKFDDSNWIGISQIDNNLIQEYCTVELDSCNKKIINFVDKSTKRNQQCFYWTGFY